MSELTLEALESDEKITELSQYQARRRLVERDYPEPSCDWCEQTLHRCRCGRAA